MKIYEINYLSPLNREMVKKIYANTPSEALIKFHEIEPEADVITIRFAGYKAQQRPH